MTITNYLSPTFYVGKSDKGFFTRRWEDRDSYYFIHTPIKEEAEVFCDHNKSFLTVNGYELCPVNYDPFNEVMI